MKASEAIKRLQELIEQHGDHDITTRDYWEEKVIVDDFDYASGEFYVCIV